MPSEDYVPITKDCEHQVWPDRNETTIPFNFCPWCGKDLRKEKSNDSIQTNDEGAI